MNPSTRQDTPEVSVVIPVYNSRNTIPILCQRLRGALETLAVSHEIIFIDDGSTDGSYDALVRESRLDRHIRLIKLTRNFGQHPALDAGLQHSRGNWILTMDDDLQNQPEDIGKLLAKTKEGYDVVCGARSKRRDSYFRRVGSRLADWLMNRLFTNLTPDSIGTFRIMSRRVVDEYLRLPEQNKYLAALVAWMGFPHTSIYVAHEKSAVGKSRYNYFQLLNMFINLVLPFSSYPLRVITWTGLVMSIVSLAMVLRTVILYFGAAQPVAGYASLFAGQMFLSGLILVSLGVIGQYLARVHDDSKGRPRYVVDREACCPGIPPERALGGEE